MSEPQKCPKHDKVLVPGVAVDGHTILMCSERSCTYWEEVKR